MEKKQEFDLKAVPLGFGTLWIGESEPLLREFIDARIRNHEEEVIRKREALFAKWAVIFVVLFYIFLFGVAIGAGK